MKNFAVSVFLLCLLLCSGTVLASTVTYTSSAAFNAALPGGAPANIENYSSFTNFQTVQSGVLYNGLTYNFSGCPGCVSNGNAGFITNIYNSFSGQSLGGLQNPGNPASNFFFGNDSFTVTFSSPVSYLGVFFNVNPNSGTFGFCTFGGACSTTGSASYDTSTFVFAGLISSTPFTSVTIFSQGSSAVYNVPQLSYGFVPAVPEPGSLILLSTGLVGVAGAFRRRLNV